MSVWQLIRTFVVEMNWELGQMRVYSFSSLMLLFCFLQVGVFGTWGEGLFFFQVICTGIRELWHLGNLCILFWLFFCSVECISAHLSLNIIEIISTHQAGLIHCYRKAWWKFRSYGKPEHVISTPSQLIVSSERNRREFEAACFGKVIRIWLNCLNCWNLSLISKHLFLTVLIFPLPKHSHEISSLSPQIHCCNASLSVNLKWIKEKEGNAMNCKC